MRKKIIYSYDKQKVNSDQKWLDIEKIALVEFTSERKHFQSSLHCYQVKSRNGVPQIKENR